MSSVPKSHPRYRSLLTREKIADGARRGLVHLTGLIAHGRGEAFDYLLGEKSQSFCLDSERVAVAALLLANNPVISVNGNVVALASEKIIALAKILDAKIEVNLFHRTDERVKLLSEELFSAGASEVFGLRGDAFIEGLDHDRGRCDKEGIFSSDVVLVPLEDGDRALALKKMGKCVIAIDLNPLSRTARCSSITIVDELCRALDNMISFAKDLKTQSEQELKVLLDSWDNESSLREVGKFLSKRLNEL